MYLTFLHVTGVLAMIVGVILIVTVIVGQWSRNTPGFDAELTKAIGERFDCA